MEGTILVLSVIVCFISFVSGTACIDNCLCDDDKCMACSVAGFSEIIRCKKCPLGCLSCQGQNFDICSSCTKKHALRNSACFPCPAGCEICSYVEQRQECKICKRGYYLNGTVCTQCFSHCMNCRSLNNCKDCNEFCISCAPNCVTCTSYSSCTKCRPGFYGESCNNTCSGGCNELNCDKQNGNCSCKQGWNGPLCDEVCPESCQICSRDTTCHKPGYHGYRCEYRCSIRCSDNLCFKNTGECMACKTNFVGGNCSSCTDGYFGENCQRICPPNCLLCSSKSSCMVCRSSFFGVTCDKKCSHRCTDSGCERNTGKCLQCKPNFIGVSCRNCSKDFEVDMCQGCDSGKYGLNCLEICPSTCKTNVCHQDNGNCLTGCRPGMFGLKCENWCPANCEQCTADISCQTCKNGYWGELCSRRCPYGCNGGCYHDGTCIACAEGSYGNFCNLSCPRHCYGGKCNTIGFCYDCISGKYGYICEQICSSHCCNGTCSRDGSCEQCKNDKGLQLGGIVTPVVFVVLALPVIVTLAVIIIKRRFAHKDSIINSTYTGIAIFDTNTADLEMATFLPRSEITPSSHQNLQSAEYELPRNTTSDTDNGEDVSDVISAHVYSGPYELTAEFSGLNTHILQRTYDTPTDGHYKTFAGADGTDREVRQYEHLTTKRGLKNYSVLQNLQSATYELPRNTTTSDTDNGEDVSDVISAHVYSGPYELTAEFSGLNTHILQRTYDTPTDGHYKTFAGADGTDREVRQYEHLTSKRGLKNYSVLQNLQSATYELPRNTTTSDIDNGEDVSDVISAHVYSSPYELPREFSGENTNILQRTNDTPTDEHYINVAGTYRETRQY